MFRQYTALRTGVYFSIVTIFYALAALLAKHEGGFVVFLEGGFAETVQLAAILASGILFLFLAKQFRSHRGVLTLLATVSFLASTRELNNTAIYRTIFAFPGASWLFGAAVLCFIAWKFGKDLPRQIRELFRLPACSLFVSGFMIVVTWAQIFAQRTIFDTSETDRIVEEGLEAAGYLLILCGVTELSYNLRDRQLPEQA